jgi:V-type H+-transporting ATPase subunit a
MLMIKPILLWWKMPASSARVSVHSHHSGSEEEDNGEGLDAPLNMDDELEEAKASPHKDHGHTQGGGAHEEHDISEIAVHQIIETIEFVLGSISNTASYLRLWALSLAHGQLARVFLEKTIGGGIVSANAIIILIGTYFFVSITVGVIMGMDSMECFLHALRLQWVEFNSKFFKADGRKFLPLNLSAPIEKNLVLLRVVE